MKLFVFRSLPLNADSRTIRNLDLLNENNSVSCTWEKDNLSFNADNALCFPFKKSGNSLVRLLKYIMFLFWVPCVIVTKAKKNDAVIFMDLETVLFGLFAAKFKGVKSIFDIVDPFSQTKRKLKFLSKIIDKVEFKYAHWVDILMVPHTSRLQYYEDILGKVIQAEKIFVIENVPSYEVSALPKSLNSFNTKFTIGYFGTLDNNSRGLESLINLALEYPDTISVIFAGQGAMEFELSNLSERHNNISFKGSFNSDQLPKLYENIDFTWAYYCPSVLLHKYAAPNKFYEHLYFDTFIITSKIIPQVNIINKLNSGIAIDINNESIKSIHASLIEFLTSTSELKPNIISDYWEKKYLYYYKNKLVEFQHLIHDQNLNISVVGTVGLPACYGGFESLVENLIVSDNKTYSVYCQSSAYQVKEKYYKKAQLKYLPLNANGIQSIPYDVASIFHSLLSNKNHLLILGVSGAIAIPLVKLFSRRKVVINIDGLEWKRSKWGKFAKWFLKFSEGVAVKYSDIVVSDNQAITAHVKAEYNKDAVTIAYGGDHAIVNELPKVKGDYYLSLCRIEPENNVEMILSAFSQTTDKLKFVGNWDNSEFGRRLKLKYSLFKNIEIVDPIYDLNALFDLRARCLGYVHGHSAGGTNPSLVEMMHFNTNIICFDCSYNRESTENKAHYFCDINQLQDLLGSHLRDNGSNMLEIAKSRYTWNIIRNQYEELF